MKKLILFFIFFNSIGNSAELVGNNTSVFNITNEKKLPDGTSYTSFTVIGGTTWNTGKYGKTNCSGNRIDQNGKLLELNNICEISINDGFKMWSKLYRSKSNIDAGVGNFIILDGTGPYKKLKGKQCIYAVSFYDELVFTKFKCDISEVLFEELKFKN